MTAAPSPVARRSLSQKITKRMREAALLARYRANQLLYLPRKPPLSPIGRHILAELRREGVAAVPLEELRFASNPDLIRAMSRASQYLDRAAPVGGEVLEYACGFDHCVPINPSMIATDFPELFMWGLDESLLDIIENCIGLEVAYHGVCIRKEIVDGRAVGTRLWHVDSEDIDVIRVMIYMNDVLDDESGPFEYVPRHSSPSYRDFPGREVITDEEMRRVVPEWRWRRAKGPRGTVLFCAVAKIFHHGKVPKNARKLASFYYTSRHPTNEALCRAFSFEPGVPFLKVPLTDRQRACLWKADGSVGRPGEVGAAPRDGGVAASRSRSASPPSPPPSMGATPSEITATSYARPSAGAPA